MKMKKKYMKEPEPKEKLIMFKGEEEFFPGADLLLRLKSSLALIESPNVIGYGLQGNEKQYLFILANPIRLIDGNSNLKYIKCDTGNYFELGKQYNTSIHSLREELNNELKDINLDAFDYAKFVDNPNYKPQSIIHNGF